jgi:hypothetical protein
MKKFVATVAASLLLVGIAGAQVHYEFHCTGTGNMVLDSPPVYGGNIDGGDLAPGTWSITIEDDGWPAPGGPTDPNGRWDYLFLNHYVWDPGAHTWTATFSDGPLYLEKTGQGSMSGVADLTVQIIDVNPNGVIDPFECLDGLHGAVIIIQDGTGIYVHLCGDGTYEGSYYRDCTVGSGTYMLDNVEFDMYLDLEDCAMGTQASTWSCVKSLFK